jgi:hypothetical protein
MRIYRNQPIASVETFGCGLSWRQRLALDADGAQHHARRDNPSDLRVASSHAAANATAAAPPIARSYPAVLTSVQSTYAGALLISVIPSARSLI